MQVSIINFTKTKSEYGFRIDAEFYKPEYVFTETCLTNIDNDILVNLVHKIDVGHVGSMVKHYCDEGTLILQTQNIKEFFVDFADCKRIDGDFHQELKKSQIHTGDILIARSGSFGKASIFLGQETINSADIIIIEPNIKIINPYYLVTFLNCAFGVNQLFRFASGGLQGHVNLTILENLIVPLLSDYFQKEIARLVNKAANQIAKSRQIYSQAEQLLLNELGLGDWQAKHKLSFVKNYSYTKQAARIDAEYFQPKYDEIINAMKTKFNARPIRDIDYISVTTGQYVADYVDVNVGKPYMRGTDIANGVINMDSLVYIRSEDQETSKKAMEGDVVVTRVGTIGLSARIPKECEGGTISDNLIRLRFDQNKLNSYYVTAYLGNIIGKSLMVRNSRGSVQQRLNQETLKEIVLPIISDSKQGHIAKQVIKAKEAWQKSKQLLKIAKQAVEMAIERDEQTAMKWIEKQGNFEE
jgi:type I restriction enzyme M protein